LFLRGRLLFPRSRDTTFLKLIEYFSASNADVVLLVLHRRLILRVHAYAVTVKPFFARIALDHKLQAVISSSANTVFLGVKHRHNLVLMIQFLNIRAFKFLLL
jgi:hypothetical protein